MSVWLVFSCSSVPLTFMRQRTILHHHKVPVVSSTRISQSLCKCPVRKHQHNCSQILPLLTLSMQIQFTNKYPILFPYLHVILQFPLLKTIHCWLAPLKYGRRVYLNLYYQIQGLFRAEMNSNLLIRYLDYRMETTEQVIARDRKRMHCRWKSPSPVNAICHIQNLRKMSHHIYTIVDQVMFILSAICNNNSWAQHKTRIKLYLCKGSDWTTHSFISNPYKTQCNICNSHPRFGFAAWLAAKETVDLEFKHKEKHIQFVSDYCNMLPSNFCSA